MRFNRNLWMVVLPASLLFGCAGPELQSTTKTVVDRSLPPVEVDSPRQRFSTEQVEQLLVLLDKADQAYGRKRLTTPLEDNALSYYRDVLLLMPSNQEALQGVERIVERYVLWANVALQKQHIDQARHYLNRALLVDKNHPSLLKLRAKIKADARSAAKIVTNATSVAPATAKTTPLKTPSTQQTAESLVVTFDDPYIRLDKTQLRARNLGIKQYLAQVAEHIKQRGSRVIIEAPSDRSGRWIYQQLNNQHEDYRIRANMKINQNPGIRLLD